MDKNMTQTEKLFHKQHNKTCNNSDVSTSNEKCFEKYAEVGCEIFHTYHENKRCFKNVSLFLITIFACCILHRFNFRVQH